MASQTPGKKEEHGPLMGSAFSSQAPGKKEESVVYAPVGGSIVPSQAPSTPEERAPKVEHFAVRVDPSHPAGHYQRGGFQFSSTADVFFDVVPEVIAHDPWLMVTKVEVGKAPAYNSQERRAKQAGRRL